MKIMKRFLRNLIIRTRLSRSITDKLIVCLSYSEFVGRMLLTTRIPHTYNDREIFWSNIVDQIGSDKPVLLLEFGVHRGESIVWFSRKFSNPSSLFFGFDTFTGLPENWEVGNLPLGTFTCKGQEPVVDDSRVSFVKGLFSDTLPETIDAIKVAAEGRTILVHFDADLFSSTLFVLTFLWQWLDRYYFLFDEFFGEESWALSVFTRSYPCQLEFAASDTPSDQITVPTPNRVFGLMRNPR